MRIANIMDFDPLLLFTPAKEKPQHEPPQLATPASSAVQDVPEEPVAIHPHDLPLLQFRPPAQVLLVFLKLLAPSAVLNFAPADNKPKPADAVFAEKQIGPVDDVLQWLSTYCPRFSTAEELATVAALGEVLRSNYSSEYNAWMTRVVASELGWVCEDDACEIKRLASLRLAENCGRTARPEFLRTIAIPGLDKSILLKEPSLTADNLGLKTWGSSFVLGSRLVRENLLKGSVLELGAGTGLVGLVACALGHPTMLTDLGEIVPNLAENVSINDAANAQVEELDWSDPARFLAKFGEVKYTTVILSDPLYSAQHPPWIVAMVDQFLEPSSDARVLLQIPIRRNFEAERARLWELMSERYVVEEEHLEQGYDDFGESAFCFKKYIRR